MNKLKLEINALRDAKCNCHNKNAFTDIQNTLSDSERIIQRIENTQLKDTLVIEEAKLLDEFLLSFAKSKLITEEITSCSNAFIELEKRITNLEKDLGSGEINNTDFQMALKDETKELANLKKHSESIEKRFQALNSAKTQLDVQINELLKEYKVLYIEL